MREDVAGPAHLHPAICAGEHPITRAAWPCPDRAPPAARHPAARRRAALPARPTTRPAVSRAMGGSSAADRLCFQGAVGPANPGQRALGFGSQPGLVFGGEGSEPGERARRRRGRGRLPARAAPRGEPERAETAGRRSSGRRRRQRQRGHVGLHLGAGGEEQRANHPIGARLVDRRRRRAPRPRASRISSVSAWSLAVCAVAIDVEPAIATKRLHHRVAGRTRGRFDAVRRGTSTVRRGGAPRPGPRRRGHQLVPLRPMTERAAVIDRRRLHLSPRRPANRCGARQQRQAVGAS